MRRVAPGAVVYAAGIVVSIAAARENAVLAAMAALFFAYSLFVQVARFVALRRGLARGLAALVVTRQLIVGRLVVLGVCAIAATAVVMVEHPTSGVLAVGAITVTFGGVVAATGARLLAGLRSPVSR